MKSNTNYDRDIMDWTAFEHGKRDHLLSLDTGAEIQNPYDAGTLAHESWDRGYIHENLLM
jgi:hypothetical protein